MDLQSGVQIDDLTDIHRDAVVSLQFASWSKTYGNVLSESFIENDLRRELDRHWSIAFESGSGLVGRGAFQGDALIGFASIYLNRDGDAFLDNLHVMPGLTSRGVGSRLMQDCLRISADHGMTNLYLWVLDENARAREFYHRHGGVESVAEVQDHFGQPLSAVRIEFRLSGPS